jgi:hypothetical protein
MRCRVCFNLLSRAGGSIPAAHQRTAKLETLTVSYERQEQRRRKGERTPLRYHPHQGEIP